LREPLRALQRARALVVSRLAAGEDPAPHFAAAGPYAPAAALAAGRHRVTGARALAGDPPAPGSRVRVVTATGNPAAVARSAGEAGFEVVGLDAWRDHHWFTRAEAAAGRRRAAADGAWTLLTAKDAVRWPAGAPRERVAVLEVAWEWVAGGEAVERLVLEGEEG
ncbi:MAG: tetraacyldisaccharide 4'-kinase, partial [Candidatus Eisenbacteria bacterium]|nr:tetraacyldisaccharide 4'-kinase [Candidatus Eisenbacteria bacterium]